MKYNIPKKFSIMGKTIAVRDVVDLDHRTDATGEARYRDYEILMQKDTEGVIMPEQKRKNIFWHEVVHWILHEMAEEECRDNEKFVEVFGSLLHQVIGTME